MSSSHIWTTSLETGKNEMEKTLKVIKYLYSCQVLKNSHIGRQIIQETGRNMQWRKVAKIRMTLVSGAYFWTLGQFISWQSSTKREKNTSEYHIQTSLYTHTHTHTVGTSTHQPVSCSQTAEREMDGRPGWRHHQAGKQPVCHCE